MESLHKTQHFNKTAAFSQHCPLWHEHRHWGIGIPGYSFGSMIQTWAIPLPSWGSAPRWLQTIYSISNMHPCFKVCRKGAYFHYFWLYSQITTKKVRFFTKSIPLAAAFIYVAISAECIWPVNRPTAVKGLRLEWMIMMKNVTIYLWNVTVLRLNGT